MAPNPFGTHITASRTAPQQTSKVRPQLGSSNRRVGTGTSASPAPRTKMQLLPPTIATDDDWHPMENAETRPLESSEDDVAPTKQRRRTTWLQWLLLSTGLATITCGAVLIGGSFSNNRSELWDIGFPLVMGGQIMFLVGLVLQLDLICAHGKRASDAITSLEEHRTMVGRPHHMPQVSPGSHSEVLLSGLKNRLDEIGKQLKHHH